MNKDSTNSQLEVITLVKKFIKDNEINNKTDIWYIENIDMINLIRDICNIVGYYKYPENNEDGS